MLSVEPAALASSSLSASRLPLTTVKVELNGVTKYVAASPTYEGLLALVKDVFLLDGSAPLTLHCVGDGESTVRIASTDDVAEAYRRAARVRPAMLTLTASLPADYPIEEGFVVVSLPSPPPVAPAPQTADLLQVKVPAAEEEDLFHSVPPSPPVVADDENVFEDALAGPANGPVISILTALAGETADEAHADIVEVVESDDAEVDAEVEVEHFEVEHEEDDADLVLHEGVECSRCGAAVRGIRFKCGHCADFDLCVKCEAVVGHDTLHVFMIIRSPIPGDHWRHRVLLPPVGATEQPKQEQEQKQVQTETKVDSNTAVPKGQSDEKEKAVVRLVSPSAAGADSSVFLSSESVGDQRVPSARPLAPGESFVQRWTLRNNSRVAWPAGVKLQLVNGDRMGAMTSVPVLMRVSPGQQVLLEAPLVAPARAGTHASSWQLTTLEGHRFGAAVSCQVVVEAPPAKGNEPLSPAAETVASQKYAEQLTRLKELGLANRAENLRLLSLYQGNLSAVVNVLMDTEKNIR